MEPLVHHELQRLQGARIALRGIEPDDFDAFYGLYSDPRVTRYWSFPAWTHPSQAGPRFAEAVAGRDPSRLLCWAIVDDEDRLVGTATLYGIDRPQARAEIGYALCAGVWGRGYARDALACVLTHAFEALQLRRIEADVDPRNDASCRLLERLGFIREGLLRERWHVAGELCDTALYGLLARDWRAMLASAP